jgi:hypothetical protein
MRCMPVYCGIPEWQSLPMIRYRIRCKGTQAWEFSTLSCASNKPKLDQEREPRIFRFFLELAEMTQEPSKLTQCTILCWDCEHASFLWSIFLQTFVHTRNFIVGTLLCKALLCVDSGYGEGLRQRDHLKQFSNIWKGLNGEQDQRQISCFCTFKWCDSMWTVWRLGPHFLYSTLLCPK